jgi:hypothetical protein
MAQQRFQWTKTTKVALSGSAQATVVTASAGGTGSGSLGGTRIVELACDTDCFISIGPSAVATLTTSIYLPAKVPVRYACNPGDTVSAIGTGGNLYISEGNGQN